MVRDHRPFDPRPAWQQEIARSRVFFCLLSPAWLRHPALRQHLAYARQLGKPVRVAVTLGAAVPDGLLDGITDLEVRVCATPEEVLQFALASFPEARGGTQPHEPSRRDR